MPDEAGLRAARRMLDLVSGLRPQDTVLCLISGGGSALLPLPLDGLTLRDKQAVNRALASGATISEMNCVRRHLSAIKGGRLAAACHPARVITLLMSDVPGDRPLDIASGHLRRPHHLRRRAGHRAALRYRPARGRAGRAALGPRRVRQTRRSAPGARRDPHGGHAADGAGGGRRRGAPGRLRRHILGDALEGEARDVGKVLAGIALQAAEREQPFRPPCVLLSGGETTVTVRGQGSGGRNVECLLSLTLMLRGHPRIHALMADTDGVDGAETSPAPASARRRWRAPGRWASSPRRPWPTTTATVSSRRWAPRSCDRRHAHQRQRFRAILIDAARRPWPDVAQAPAPLHTENLSHVPTPQPPRQDRRHAGSGQQRPRYPPQPVPCRRGRVPAELQPRAPRITRSRMAILREIEAETGRPIGVMADLQGPSCAWAPSRRGRCNCSPASASA